MQAPQLQPMEWGLQGAELVELVSFRFPERLSCAHSESWAQAPPGPLFLRYQNLRL